MSDIQIDIHSQFGEFCARGDAAVRLLKTNVYPNVCAGSKIIFDFDGVRNINSSFSNALFANLVRKFGEDVLDQVQIINAKPNIRNEIVSSFMLANTEHEIVQSYEIQLNTHNVTLFPGKSRSEKYGLNLASGRCSQLRHALDIWEATDACKSVHYLNRVTYARSNYRMLHVGDSLVTRNNRSRDQSKLSI